MKSSLRLIISTVVLTMVLILCAITTGACTDGSKGLEYEVNSDGETCTITGLGTYSSKDLVIPNTIGGYKVTAIADRAFKDTDIETFSGGESITKIGIGAFHNCKQLKRALVPDGVTKLEGWCFQFCESLSDVTLPPYLVSIGYAAFAECSSLVTLDIPDTVLEIEEHAFDKCKNLSNVKLPPKLKSIETCVFFECLSLVTINIPETVIKIGDAAFAACQRITSISIPNKVETIGAFAFMGCQSLKEIIIPDSVTEIGQSAFSFCFSLTEIYFPASVTKIGTSPLAYTNLTSIDVDANSPILSSIDGNLYHNGTIFLNYAGGKSDSYFSIPNGIIKIATESFVGCLNLKTLSIPQSVKFIGSQVFHYSPNIETLYYDGTVDGWENITKMPDWNANTESIFTIICTDGTIAMDGTVTYN